MAKDDCTELAYLSSVVVLKLWTIPTIPSPDGDERTSVEWGYKSAPVWKIPVSTSFTSSRRSFQSQLQEIGPSTELLLLCGGQAEQHVIISTSAAALPAIHGISATALRYHFFLHNPSCVHVPLPLLLLAFIFPARLLALPWIASHGGWWSGKKERISSTQSRLQRRWGVVGTRCPPGEASQSQSFSDF